VESSQTISLKKNYTMRVSNSDIQELQALSTAFNGLLCEIEQSNQSLMTENNKLLHQSRHDPLTQLPNRPFFYETLFQYYEEAGVRNAAVLFIDLNDFKQVNDQFGHLAGDAVLRASSYCVRKVLPENAFFSRLGGDEFAVIIPDVMDSDEIQQLCQKIHACYTSTYMFEQQHIFLDASIGVALTQLSKSPEDLISDADQAMYDAKNFAEKWHISLQSKSKQA
jgi:diguanylate cyclase